MSWIDSSRVRQSFESRAFEQVEKQRLTMSGRNHRRIPASTGDMQTLVARSKSHIYSSVEALQTILNAIPNPVFLKDRQHRIVLVNDAHCKLMGRTPDDILNSTDESYVPQEQLDVFWKVDNDVLATGLPNENEEVLTDGNGSLRVILTRKSLIHLPTSNGVEPFIIAVITDVTRFREAEARARYLAEHDPLTGLANRTQLGERLETALDAARKIEARLAVLLLDLDGFKAINDQYGHPVGDEVLRVVSKRLAGILRTVDTVSRLGGDEFCIVQASLEHSGAANDLADRIIAALASPIVVGTLRVAVSTSIGIAVFPDDGGTSEQLLHRADIALYAAKRAGRRGYKRYDGRASIPDTEDWDVESDLRAALAHDQLSLAFQPLAAAADGTVRGFETLARWDHPTRGQIAPDLFIPVAESAGLIHELGSWVLHKACAAAATWPWDLQVAVNVSPIQLENADLVAAVKSALAASNLPAGRLELEITETALLGSNATALAIFSELKALGVSLALDDFGSGWSSLATLRDFKFDRIKIDRSFITHIESDAHCVAIVRAVLSLGLALNVPVTAEGVEAHGQLAALRQMGCAELQGYYLGRPRPEATLPDSEPWIGFVPNRRRSAS
ncbi:EAL domain-containing protein [Bosea thiooxidans]